MTWAVFLIESATVSRSAVRTSPADVILCGGGELREGQEGGQLEVTGLTSAVKAGG